MKKTSADVLLYYPNIIGYLRVVFMFASFYFALTNWKVTIICYLLAFAGDALDGYVARKCNQCSKLGGVLDMVTDRVSNGGLFVILGNLYSGFLFVFIFLLVLDISSHWMHMTSVSAHHKSTEALEHRNPVLKWYYSIYPLFGYCCVGTELFYVLLYVLKFYPHPIIYQICVFGCLPACILKQIVNVFQLISAAYAIAEVDAKSA